MPIRRITTILLAACGFILVAACDSGGPSESTPTAQPAPATSPPAEAAVETAPRELAVDSETLPYADVDEKLAYGHFAIPSDMIEPRPAVLLVHDWWGLNDDARDAANRLAAAGYVVLAIDLYGGATANSADDARQRMIAIVENPADVEENIRQALGFLETAGAPSVGVVGWGFGGGWVLNAALAFPDRIDAVVTFYGQVGNDATRFRELRAPVLGLFAENDSGIPADTIEAFAEATNFAASPAQIEIYPGVRHGFADPKRNAYEPQAAADAWQRMLDFLAEHLTSEP